MTSAEVEELLLSKYRDAEHWGTILEGCDALVAGDRPAKLALLISGLSSGLTDSRIHLYTMGRSQSGKSWVQSRIGAYLFKNFEKIDSSSPKALYYEAIDDPGRFKNSILLYDEFADKSEELQNQVKALTSHGVDSATLKTVDIKRKFLEVPVEGLPVVWMNSATHITNDQILNRFLKINTDETPSQDDTIRKFQQSEEEFGSLADREKEAIERANLEILLILDKKDIKVLNPFATFWDMALRANRNMRPMLSSIIRVMAYSNRVLRPHVGEEMILASLTDNIIGIHIWNMFEAYQTKKVPSRHLRLLNALRPEGRYTKKALAEAYASKYSADEPLSPSSCYQYARQMEKLGLLSSEYLGLEKLFYPMPTASSRSEPRYDSNGVISGLTLGSLDVQIPTLDRLAKRIEMLSKVSLTSFQIIDEEKTTASAEDARALAECLLDWEFLYKLANVLEVTVPQQTGSPSNTSNTSILDYVRDEPPASAAQQTLGEKVDLVKQHFADGMDLDCIREMVDAATVDHCLERGIIPKFGGLKP